MKAHRVDPALVVVLAGVAAALHVGKLPPALPVLRESLDLSLVQAGFLLSLVQLAGMALGLVVGLASDTLGLRRCMATGLLVLGAAGLAGGFSPGAAWLLALRAVEGCGFLLAVTPGPSLIRRVAAPAEFDAKMGLWATYMPLGTALALLLGPWLLPRVGWPGWWWAVAALSLAMALWLRAALPADPRRGAAAALQQWHQRLRRTLSAPGPWWLALSFFAYSMQWLAVVGFLPSIYAQSQVDAVRAGLLTALVAAANMVGSVAAGRLLRRGVAPQHLLRLGFAGMALGAALAFLPALDLGAALRFAAVTGFSMVGGLLPATLFALSVRLSPGADTVSTTVGWMQQCSAVGQFAGPPLVAWVARQTGGWHWTWAATGAFCLLGWLLAGRIAAALAAR